MKKTNENIFYIHKPAKEIHKHTQKENLTMVTFLPSELQKNFIHYFMLFKIVFQILSNACEYLNTGEKNNSLKL